MTSRFYTVALSLIVAATFALPYAAHAQAKRSFEDAKLRLNYEPAVSETMQAALRYFRVDPGNFDRLRKTANLRALLPTLAAGYRLDSTNADLSRTVVGDGTSLTAEGTGTRVHTLSVGAVWDLRELVFNPAEVQVYGLIGVQRDLMLETTRIYYLRKQLFVRFLNSPPRDPLAREALMLRVDEFTALLDVLTGGWFSKTTDKRVVRAQKRRDLVRKRRETRKKKPQNNYEGSVESTPVRARPVKVKNAPAGRRRIRVRQSYRESSLKPTQKSSVKEASSVRRRRAWFQAR